MHPHVLINIFVLGFNQMHAMPFDIFISRVIWTIYLIFLDNSIFSYYHTPAFCGGFLKLRQKKSKMFSQAKIQKLFHIDLLDSKYYWRAY